MRRLQGQTPIYHGTIHAFQQTWKSDKLFGFWRGWAPGVQRSAIVGGFGLSFYDQSKDILEKFDIHRGSVSGHVLASLWSGLITTLVSVPLDVVKVRMMATHGVVERQGVLRMMITIGKSEGVLGLYKGFLPAYVRMGPWQV
jgi:hypothetical protein